MEQLYQHIQLPDQIHLQVIMQTGLPPGLSVNTTTGQITGTPTSTSGSPYTVAISATNGNGIGTANLIYTINKVPLTITGLSVTNKPYDGTISATTNGTASLSGIVAGDASNVTLGGTPSAVFASASVGTGKTVTVTGYTISGSASGNYTLSQPASLTANITALPVTVSGATASNKPYDGNTTAFISGGILSGVLPAETSNVSLSTTGTFAIANAGTGIGVTASLTGSAAGNYALTQPGLTANITIANQTITFGALANKNTGSSPFALTATASSALTVSYISSNTAVATISGSTLTIVGVGTTNITASQAGNGNYNPAPDVTQPLVVTLASAILAGWDFFGQSSPVTFAATTFNTNLDNSSTLSNITRGTGAVSSSGGNSFRTTGFMNDGISTSNTDYFQITLKIKNGFSMNLSTIDGSVVGTSTYSASPGVTMQFAYSLDGTTFTLIGSPVVVSGTTPATMPSIDLSGVSTLQNIPFGTTVYIRYYATGQTNTGGWGFSSATAGTYGLAIGGSLIAYPPTVTSQAASVIAATTATGNGNITNIGGAAPTTRGFCWDLATNADPTTALSTKTTETGPFSTGAFTGSLTGLSPNTSYKVRAYATNSGGTSYGAAQTFTTSASSASIFSGTGNWGDVARWNNGIPGTATDVTIDGTATITLSDNADCKNLTIGTGSLTINSGASLITNGAVTGNATVKSYIEGNKWHLISSPVSGALSGSFSMKYLQSFDEAAYKYLDIQLTTVELLPGQGFALWGDNLGFTHDYVGPLNTGSVIISGLTRTDINDADKSGWNLIGNPYPSVLDWNSVSKTNLNTAIYIANGNDWAIYNSGVGVPSTSSQYIAPGQGILVQVAVGTTGGSITMDNSARVHNSATFYKKASVTNLARLQVSGNSYTDEAVVRFASDATSEFDGNYDAHKFFSEIPGSAQIYTLGSSPLAINALLPETTEVPLGIRANTAGTYTIAATQLLDMPSATLEDTQTGIFTDLSAGSYSFTAGPDEKEVRFILHFNTSVTSLTDPAKSLANIYSYQKTAFIDLKDQAKGNILIYNVSGQLIRTQAASKGMNEVKLPNTGIYMVKVITAKSTMVKKIWIE